MGEAPSPAPPVRRRRIPPSLLTLLFVLSFCCFRDLRSDAQTLDRNEVAALREVAKKLKINSTVWDFNVEPCNWMSPSISKLVFRDFTCGNCNTTTNICHVVNIQLMGHNLTGVLPEEFGNLTSLAQLDLTRNYISGSIPAASWASSPLLNISLSANRLSGPIPEAIGRITTLQSLVIENNMMQGRLPWGLGNLKNLTRLLLSGNNFTGQLPDTLGNLKNLIDFRIDGSGVSGKIPSFISNWTRLKRLDMQGTSLEGPFPSNLSLLEELTDLRVTDLKKSDGNFPSLASMTKMKYLVLRNCSISGQIPVYIQTMAKLKTLYGTSMNLVSVVDDKFVLGHRKYLELASVAVIFTNVGIAHMFGTGCYAINDMNIVPPKCT